MNASAVVSAANKCALLGVLLVLFGLLSGEIIEISALVTGPLVFWSIGAFSSAILLAFLVPVFMKIKRQYSLLLFLGIGFSFPFSMGYFMSSIGAHGNPSSLESDLFRAMSLILVYSVMGCCASFSSWRSLNAYSKKNT
jgi:hypothetical protein